MGIFDSQQQTQPSGPQMPQWMVDAGKNNYMMAQGLASRPYTPYSFKRLAGFSDDQTKAQGLLRDFKPSAMTNGTFKMPRVIDNIPGMGEQAGSTQDYMNPYIDQVLNRTQDRIRRDTDIAKIASSDRSAQGAGAFGDARHGVADSLIEESGIRAMGDAAAEGYAAAFNNAMGLKQADLTNIYNSALLNRDNDNSVLSYIQALNNSGADQQGQEQKNLDMMYSDFLRQLGYPQEQLNSLISTLAGTPYNPTTTTQKPSTASNILGTVGSIASMFL